METLANLESFVRSAESGSFSAAARRLALTPAAVSRNVAQLEANLGVRLFQRSTRRLPLTEAGERFLQTVSGGLDSIQSAIADLTSNAGQPAGVLKLSAAPSFGRDYLLPLMPEFLARYPAVQPDWHLDNRQVDLIAEGFDVAIGGGFELTPGVVARRLAPAHLVAVATPTYLQGRRLPSMPEELQELDCLAMRSMQNGRVRLWHMRNAAGAERALELQPRMTVNDPQALCRGVLLDMGVALLAMPDVLAHLDSGALVRLLPDWYVDAGPISLYFSSQKLLPAKTRAFIDFVTAAAREREWATRLSVSGGPPRRMG
ncbi:LysR family transcriptional regulator [Pseudomonas cavernae]|uniref:LysR family transcriptional regulator n=1 Tax=Pseudomonas cavernae TaxID=2320867 RepID=A0A385YYU1_9PSED|nr:LysR family transcriptional regulator [Pseudomonas cavernae]AYC32045.1 LysR family transcriptional regulator [Pseudomonas cavernae]